MPGAHVFNVPQAYRKDPAADEKPRSKFRFFGHGLRLGSKHASTPSTTSSTTHRRTKSSYIASEDEYSPTSSPRVVSKSLTSEADLSSDRSHSLLKFGLLKRQHNADTNSLRSSIASTVSTSSTALSDDLSPPSSTASFLSTPPLSSADDEIHSPRLDYATRELLRDVVGVDATWADDAHVRRHYDRLQWRVVRIQADGNCLFRAVSDQIYRNEAFYGDIRRRVVEYIEREKELFQPFVENEQTGKFEPIDTYCNRLKRDGEWGGNPELFAVARLFNVHIVVHQGPMRRLRIESGRVESPDLEMHLLFRNDHYDSLHDETQLDEKPRLSTSIAMDLLEHAAVEARAEVSVNQRDEVKTEKTKKKKKKAVVFIGEQTRVERVEVLPLQMVMHAPVRLVLRRGRVCTLDEWNQEENQHEHEAHNQRESETEVISRDEPCQSDEPQPFPETNPPSDNQESELNVARIKKVSFRRGRRVAA